MKEVNHGYTLINTEVFRALLVFIRVHLWLIWIKSKI